MVLTERREGQRITRRQHAVLDLVARGYANKQIAGELAISEGAVKKHVSHLMLEFQAPNRTALVNVAAMRSPRKGKNAYHGNAARSVRRPRANPTYAASPRPKPSPIAVPISRADSPSFMSRRTTGRNSVASLTLSSEKGASSHAATMNQSGEVGLTALVPAAAASARKMGRITSRFTAALSGSGIARSHSGTGRPMARRRVTAKPPPAASVKTVMTSMPGTGVKIGRAHV